MFDMCAYDDNHDICMCDYVPQGRTLGESTAGRRRRRSFMPPSFFEDDTVDFPDELDTSFFTRVSREHALAKL